MSNEKINNKNQQRRTSHRTSAYPGEVMPSLFGKGKKESNENLPENANNNAAAKQDGQKAATQSGQRANYGKIGAGQSGQGANKAGGAGSPRDAANANSAASSGKDKGANNSRSKNHGAQDGQGKNQTRQSGKNRPFANAPQDTMRKSRPQANAIGKAPLLNGGFGLTVETPAPAAARAPQSVLKKAAALALDSSAVVRIVSLGGLNEVGKNLTVIECDGKMLVVDCGIAFPDDSMPGVDLVLPDFTYLEKNADKILAVIVTHGHEDHTGGLPYLLKKINAPVYATRLTCGLIKNKLDEHRILDKTKLYQVEYGDILNFGCMKVEVIRSNHSIPDACVFSIETPAGRIVFTGDFKIDSTPIDGEMIDLTRLGELGRQGILALLSDSTNAERPGYTKSERIVGETLNRLFSASNKRIIVTTFASNIHRVKQIMDAAAAHGRKVVISGRSMVNNVKAAIELGVIKVDEGRIIDISALKNYEPGQVVLVTTGSQGEPMSALSRMAFADHRNVEIGPSDLVIISASPIPGNEKTVSKVINELLKRGAQVITTKQAEVHVSGHASKEEHKLLLALTKPKFFIPIHGEYSHLVAHAATAKDMGIPESRIIISDIGKMIELTAKSCKLTGTVPSGKVLIDGLGVGDVGNVVLRDRRHLAEDGLVVVIAAVDTASGMLLSGPEVISRGFVYVKESEDLLDAARNVLRKAIESEMAEGVREHNILKSAMKDALSSFIYQKTKRTPMILPFIMEG